MKLKEKISDLWDDIWYDWLVFSHVRDSYYKVKNLLKRPDLIRTGLPKTQYSDAPEKLLYGIMNTIVEHVEIEKCFEHTDYNSTVQWKEVGETIKEVYDWWKDYPNRQEEITIAIDNWYRVAFPNAKNDKELFVDRPPLKILDNEIKRYSKIHRILEERLKEEEKEMLLKIIKIRMFLWT